MSVKLWKEHIKDLGSDTTIESIVNVLSLLLILEILRKGKVGVDQAHHSSP